MKISVITPVYNEAGNLPFVFNRLQRVAGADPARENELLFVDDHSTDATALVLRKFAASDMRVCLLRLSRNFGSHAACTVGLARCTEDAVVILAAEGQDPTEIIPQLLEPWHKSPHVLF